MVGETVVPSATERIHIKIQIEKYPMSPATQSLSVTLTNFHVSDQVMPPFKTLKASQGPPDKVASL